MSSKKNSKDNPSTRPKQNATNRTRQNLGSAKRGQESGTAATDTASKSNKTATTQKKKLIDRKEPDVAPFDLNEQENTFKQELLRICIRFDIHKPEELLEILEKHSKKDEGESNQPRETISPGSNGATQEVKKNAQKKTSERMAKKEKVEKVEEGTDPAKDDKIAELERRLQEKDKEISDLSKKIKTATQLNNDFQDQKGQQRDSKKDTDNKWEEIVKTLKREISDLNEKLQTATQLNNDLQDQKGQQRDAKKDTDIRLEGMVQTFNSEKEQLEIQLTSARKKVEELQSELDKAKKEAKKSLDPNTKKLKDEIDQLKNRLSQLAGSKLTEGNPAIADLSDMNRPINLGEKFSELYDNQWTDAFEELQEKEKKEADAIKALVNIVTDAYIFCKNQSEFLHKEMKNLLKHFNMDPEKLPSEVSKHIKDYRKALSVSVLQDIQERFCSGRCDEEGRRVMSYARQCIAVCWFMTVQDPPVFMDVDLPHKNIFDNDKYRAYTKTGGKIRFLVWPVLYLHEGGPLLCKGVAQGK